MSDIDKSYNRFKKQYRIQRANHDSDEWTTSYLQKSGVELLIQTKFESSNFKFRLFPYKLYFFRSIIWFLKLIIADLRIQLKKVQITNIRTIVIGIIISISGYGILKFILHWI